MITIKNNNNDEQNFERWIFVGVNSEGITKVNCNGTYQEAYKMLAAMLAAFKARFQLNYLEMTIIVGKLLRGVPELELFEKENIEKTQEAINREQNDQPTPPTT